MTKSNDQDEFDTLGPLDLQQDTSFIGRLKSYEQQKRWVMGHRSDFYYQQLDYTHSTTTARNLPHSRNLSQLRNNPQQEQKKSVVERNLRKNPHCSSIWIGLYCLILQFLTSTSCPLNGCASNFTSRFESRKVTFGPNIASCTLLDEYLTCFGDILPQCSGDLRFYSLRSMARNYHKKHNCTAVIDQYQMANSQATATSSGTKCLFPYRPQSSVGGSSDQQSDRYCTAFGDPHLRTFDGQHETCRTLGAWPLVDNAYLNIQMVSEAVSQGLSSDVSAITKVSIIVKALPGCTGQKTFEATGDFLPSWFEDGTIHSGEPSTSNGDTYPYYYGDGQDAQRPNRIPPALFIQTLRPNSHVELHLRYVATRIVLRRFGKFLSVALKMPEEALAQDSTLSEWQLCLSGCPLTEKIDFRKSTELVEQVTLSGSTAVRISRYSGDGNGNDDNVDVRDLDAKAPYSPSLSISSGGGGGKLLSINAAEAICKSANVTGFFYDSCVFDMVVSGGNADFRDMARMALVDIRRLYPYFEDNNFDANRTTLGPYAQGLSAYVSQLAESRTDLSDHWSSTNSAAASLTYYLQRNWVNSLVAPFVIIYMLYVIVITAVR